MKTFVRVTFLFLLLAGCGVQNITPDSSLIEIQTPKPVILDVDMVHEDMFSASSSYKGSVRELIGFSPDGKCGVYQMKKALNSLTIKYGTSQQWISFY